MACLAEARGHSPPSPFGLRRGSLARCASAGWWGKKDSNLRSHKTADLQSAPFATRDTPPFNSIANPTARSAAAEAMDDVSTVSRWRAPGRARLWGKGHGKVNQWRTLIE